MVVEGGGERVVVRVEPDKTDRYRVRELHLLDTGEPVTAERLRAVRVAALEHLLQPPEERVEIRKRLPRPPSVDFELVVDRFDDVGQPRTVYGRSHTVLEMKASSRGSVTPGLAPPLGVGTPTTSTSG